MLLASFVLQLADRFTTFAFMARFPFPYTHHCFQSRLQERDAFEKLNTHTKLPIDTAFGQYLSSGSFRARFTRTTYLPLTPVLRIRTAPHRLGTRLRVFLGVNPYFFAFNTIIIALMSIMALRGALSETATFAYREGWLIPLIILAAYLLGYMLYFSWHGHRLLKKLKHNIGATPTSCSVLVKL